MVTLMRTLKLFALGALFVIRATLTVNAQAPAAQPQAPEQPTPAPAPQTPAQSTPSQDADWLERLHFFFNFSVGGQNKDQTFTDSSTFPIYTERGAVASAHSIGGGTLFDTSAGVRFWKNAGIGIAYSSIQNKNDATVSVRVPHPIIFGLSRTATATATALEHTENVVHLQFMWTLPVTDKLDLTVMAGPSFFTVRQTIATVRAPQDIRDVAPFTTVTINTLSLTDVKDSPVGVHIGADASYYAVTFKGVGIGVGGFARWAGADLDLPITDGLTRDTELKTGGPQGGLGLRLRF
jgi:hypothetical protein